MNQEDERLLEQIEECEEATKLKKRKFNRATYEKIRNDVIARYLEGYSSNEVGKEFKISYGTVIRWVHEAGYDGKQMKRKRLQNQLEKGEDKRGKMKRDVRRKVDQVLIYCRKVEELAKEIDKWILEETK